MALATVQPLQTVEHAYRERTVRLQAVMAEVAAEAVATPVDGVDWRWIALAEDLARTALPPANSPITAAAAESLGAKM